MGALAPIFYQTATYHDIERYAETTQCHWNLALGVELDELLQNGDCRVALTGTVSSEPFDDFDTPPDAIWPLVTWDVALTLDQGRLSCGGNPLDGLESGVSTSYTELRQSAAFAFRMSCEEATPIAASEDFEVWVGDERVAFKRNGGGIGIEFNGVEETYELPDPEWRLSGPSRYVLDE